jgi:polysaccharide deacetylase 2 family uncharacterized protein YibQ
MADDLSAPLGQNKAPKRTRRVPLAVPYTVLGLASVFVAVLAGWAMIVDDPFGGEPLAIVPTDLQAVAATSKPEDGTIVRPAPGEAGGKTARPNRYDGPAHETPPPAAPAGKTITIIDGTSGKREQVVIPDRTEQKPAALDKALTEPSRHGPLPKVAADGSRAADVYARPVKALPDRPDAPRIAIVVGGLGIGATATGDALGNLPAAVTLAFAPYGDNLERLAARARNDGHEVLLQVPMEPLDYPENDPGPQTLLTSLDAGQNIDRLHWLMSRMQGYVGLANYMGARFTASEPALLPVMKEASKRGLLFLDDSSSSRSIAGQVAGASGLAFAKADVIVDATPTAADVDRALARLEAMARDRGLAVGVASALPVSVDRISKWAKGAEGRGVLLVPISAAAKRPMETGKQTTENRAAGDARKRTESR